MRRERLTYTQRAVLKGLFEEGPQRFKYPGHVYNSAVSLWRRELVNQVGTGPVFQITEKGRVAFILDQEARK